MFILFCHLLLAGQEDRQGEDSEEEDEKEEEEGEEGKKVVNSAVRSRSQGFSLVKTI